MLRVMPLPAAVGCVIRAVVSAPYLVSEKQMKMLLMKHQAQRSYSWVCFFIFPSVFQREISIKNP